MTPDAPKNKQLTEQEDAPNPQGTERFSHDYPITHNKALVGVHRAKAHLALTEAAQAHLGPVVGAVALERAQKRLARALRQLRPQRLHARDYNVWACTLTGRAHPRAVEAHNPPDDILGLFPQIEPTYVTSAEEPVLVARSSTDE